MAAENNNLDLFSLLPESILLAIVSFLPFKEAAAITCILNKKWFNIWKSGNDIDFEENFFVDSTSDEIKQAQRKVFIDFITNWLAHFNHRDINKFSLKISNPHSCSNNTIESCVDFAAQRRVKDLTLDFSDKNNYKNNINALFPMPTQVYQIESSLETLKLSSCRFDVLDFLNFDALRDLSLSWIGIKLKTLKTLLKFCRTIDSLSLEKCWGLEDLNLGSETIWLTRLVVNNCQMDSDYYYLSFNAPVLKYFKYSGHEFSSDINAKEIEEVELDFTLETRYNDEHNYHLWELLLNLSATKILTVCSYLLQVIPSGEKLKHLNVKHLILNTQMHHNELGGLEYLLKSFTSMEKLTLNIGSGVIFEDYIPPYYDLNVKEFWLCRRKFPECLITSLKVVEVNKSKATDSEYTTLCIFMHVGKVLEQININICNADDGLTELEEIPHNMQGINEGVDEDDSVSDQFQEDDLSDEDEVGGELQEDDISDELPKDDMDDEEDDGDDNEFDKLI